MEPGFKKWPEMDSNIDSLVYLYMNRNLNYFLWKRASNAGMLSVQLKRISSAVFLLSPSTTIRSLTNAYKIFFVKITVFINIILGGGGGNSSKYFLFTAVIFLNYLWYQDDLTVVNTSMSFVCPIVIRWEKEAHNNIAEFIKLQCKGQLVAQIVKSRVH